MDRQQIHATFDTWRYQHARPAWRPMVASDSETPGRTRFGGDPCMAWDQSWPACETCQTPMQFFLQLDVATIPIALGYPLREGLIQLFYCSVDDGRCETWAPFSGTHAVGWLSDRHVTSFRTVDIPALPPRSIATWSQFHDYPHPEEHQRLGIHYDYQFSQHLVTVTCDQPRIRLMDLPLDLDVAESISQAAAGDKLGGWPNWVQDVEYPRCPCGRGMELLLQVDSGDQLAYQFGDMGCGHLTYCPDHPETLAFGWACS